MKVIQKSLVAAGLATAVFATGAAQAATISNPSTATTPAYATYIPNNVSSTVVDLPDILIQMGATEIANEDDSLELTLSAGTWAAATEAEFSANANGAGPGTGAGTTEVALVSGGSNTAGSSSVKYRIAAAGGAGELLQFSGLQVNASSVADNGTISVQLDMKGFVGGESTSLFGTPLTSLQVSKQPVYTFAVSQLSTATFDVASGFTAFTSTSGSVSSTTGVASADTTIGLTAVTLNPVFGGTLAATTADSTNASATTPVAADVPAAEPLTRSVMYTINGPMANIAAISCTACTAASSAGVASTATGATGSMTIDTAAEAAYAVADALGNNFTFRYNGTDVNLPSAYSISVGTLTDLAGGYSASTIGSGAIASFSRNGSSFVTNSFGSKNKITVTDHSGVTGAGGADGAITLTAYDADGAPVTCTGLSIPNVEANASVTIQGADVLAACPGAKRIDGVVNSTTINVTNVKITADGATMQSGNNAGAGVIAQ